MSKTEKQRLEEMPIVAIIRGVTPSEVLDVVDALYQGGIRVVEIPLNSPDPLVSIQKITKQFRGRMLMGAGTVLQPAEVKQVRDAGGKLIVSPNVRPDVIEATKKLDLFSYPGIMTVTEAFQAIDAGADGLKLFPADLVGPGFVKAARAVLPKHIPLLAVGGVNHSNMVEWLSAGAAGFGIGSSLYRPGMTADQVFDQATKIVQAFRQSRDHAS